MAAVLTGSAARTGRTMPAAKGASESAAEYLMMSRRVTVPVCLDIIVASLVAGVEAIRSRPGGLGWMRHVVVYLSPSGRGRERSEAGEGRAQRYAIRT